MIKNNLYNCVLLFIVLLFINPSIQNNNQNECQQKETKLKCLTDLHFSKIDTNEISSQFIKISQENNLTPIEQALLKLEIEQKINSDSSHSTLKDQYQYLQVNNEKQYEKQLIDEKIINLQIYLEQMKQKIDQEIENYLPESQQQNKITENYEKQIKEDQEIFDVLDFKFRFFYQPKHHSLKFLIEYINDYVKNNKQILQILEPFLEKYQNYLEEKAPEEDQNNIKMFLDEQKSYSDAKLLPISQQSTQFIMKLFKQILTQGPKNLPVNQQNQISYLSILKQQSQINVNQPFLERNVKQVFDFHFVSNEEIEDYDYNELQKTLSDQFFLNKRKQYQKENKKNKGKSNQQNIRGDDTFSEDYSNIQFYELSLEGIINEDKWVADQVTQALKNWQKTSELPTIETVLRIFRILQQKPESMNTLEHLRNFMNIWFTDVIKYATMYKDSILQKQEDIQFKKQQLELHEEIIAQDEKIHYKAKLLLQKEIKNLEKQLSKLYEFYADDQAKVNQFKQSRQFLKSIDVRELHVNIEQFDQ